MATRAEADAVLDALAKLREQAEALDDPGREDLLYAIRTARTEAEAVRARALGEEQRQKTGVGARPRYGRTR